MNKYGIIGLVCMILVSCSAVSQKVYDIQIDSISEQIIFAFQENEPENLEFHLVKKEDLVHVLELLKNKMSKEQIEMTRSQFNTIPNEVRDKWLEKYANIQEQCNEALIFWNEATYLSSKIKYEEEEDSEILTAQVKAIFRFSDKYYNVEYECIKMPRGWVFGNKFNLNEVVEKE